MTRWTRWGRRDTQIPGFGATEVGDLITERTCIRHLLHARDFAWHQ